jgi:predicted double-glycine peptidase
MRRFSPCSPATRRTLTKSAVALRSGQLWLLSAFCGVFYAQNQTSLWLDVPFVQQVKAGCGSAAVAMVTEYWARQFPDLAKAQADAERIDAMLPAISPKGIGGEALKRYLEDRGFRAFIFEGELSDVRSHFAKGRPLIVCLAPKRNRGLLHYAVVVGIDEKDVWLNDSARGRLFREDVDRFVNEWRGTGNWALLAVPRHAQ